jgi:hypothetical protein
MTSIEYKTATRFFHKTRGKKTMANPKLDANTDIDASLVGSTRSSLTVDEEQPPSTPPVEFIERLAISEDELKAQFLRAAAENKPEVADDFFRRFEYLNELLAGNPHMALVYGRSLLFLCKQFDLGLYKQIHKGTPYYWLGMSAFFVKDFQTATFFFDAAVSEDIRAGRDPKQDPSPSFHFILLEGQQPGQAAQLLVESMEKRVETALGD